jgi:chromosome partitioning protein
MAQMTIPADPEQYAEIVAKMLARYGYTVSLPPEGSRSHTLEVEKEGRRFAVLLKNHKAKCNLAQIEKFLDFIDAPGSERFSGGWFISASGFSKPAITHIESVQSKKLSLWIHIDNKLQRRYPTLETAIADTAPSKQPVRQKYFGVFTCKGGVGKTTIAAHLAGAFALMGYDVVLLDLDPEKNLRKLFMQGTDDEAPSLYLPSLIKGRPGSTITVLNHDEWEPSQYRDMQIIICDCSPVLEQNPASLVGRFDYCIVPTTLTPLGIAKNADVITRTFRHIRQMNRSAALFALINGYDPSEAVAKKNEKLLQHLARHLSAYIQTDPLSRFIHPDDAVIRFSTILQYWGFHLIDGSKPQLAFSEQRGKNHPRTDFLKLADYLEDHTNIEELRKQEG